jgi:hypothetical protein
MSIADIIIYTLDFIFQHTILAILPSSVGGLTMDALQASLTSLQTTMIAVFSGFGFIAPMALILSLCLIVLTAEFTLFSFHIVLFIVKMIRGAG